MTPLKAQNAFILGKFEGGMALWPPWLRLWCMVSSAECECGAEEQSADHVVLQCL